MSFSSITSLRKSSNGLMFPCSSVRRLATCSSSAWVLKPEKIKAFSRRAAATAGSGSCPSPLETAWSKARAVSPMSALPVGVVR
ncbi:MAG: hypothetical protein J6T96_07900 [Bacteroidales bacterium]|nr:hypothetical protein [Bacteroidales bacterium]